MGRSTRGQLRLRPRCGFRQRRRPHLLLINFYSQPVLYRNETNDMNWLRVKPQGKKTGRDGIGAKVSVIDSDGRWWVSARSSREQATAVVRHSKLILVWGRN